MDLKSPILRLIAVASVSAKVVLTWCAAPVRVAVVLLAGLALTPTLARASSFVIDRSSNTGNNGSTNAGQSFKANVNDGFVGNPVTVYLQSIEFWTGGVGPDTTADPLYLKIFTGFSGVTGTGLVGASTNMLARTTTGESMLYLFDDLALNYSAGTTYYALTGPNLNDGSFAAQPRQFGGDAYSGGDLVHCNFCPGPAENPAVAGTLVQLAGLDARFVITMSDTPLSEEAQVPEPNTLVLVVTGMAAVLVARSGVRARRARRATL